MLCPSKDTYFDSGDTWGTECCLSSWIVEIAEKRCRVFTFYFTVFSCLRKTVWQTYNVIFIYELHWTGVGVRLCTENNWFQLHGRRRVRVNRFCVQSTGFGECEGLRMQMCGLWPKWVYEAHALSITDWPSRSTICLMKCLTNPGWTFTFCQLLWSLFLTNLNPAGCHFLLHIYFSSPAVAVTLTLAEHTGEFHSEG